MPTEEGDAAATHIKGRYSPPASDVWGVLIALSVISIWALVFHHAIWGVRLPTKLADVHVLPTALWPASAPVSHQPFNASGIVGQAMQFVTNTSQVVSSTASQQCKAEQGAACGGSSSLLEIILTFMALEFMYTGEC
jgi:hypothetical protein